MKLINQAIAAAVVSSAASSISTIFFAQAIHYIHPLLAIGVSVTLGAFIVFCIMRLRGTTLRIETILQSQREMLVVTLFRSILLPVLFAVGLSYSSGVKAIFITKMEPYVLILLSWLCFKATPTKKESVLLTTHIAGAILLSTGGDLKAGEILWGDLVLLSAVIISALTYRTSRVISERVGILQTAFVSESLGACLLLPIALFLVPSSGFASANYGWMYLALHSFLFSGVALTLWFRSLTGIPLWLSSALRAIGPLIAAPFAWFCFGERLSALQLLGGTIVLLTSVILARSHQKDANR